jgi:DNA-binding MarR family transcriptional regulator
MKNLIDQFERYLREILGITVTPTPWESANRLPFFLRDRYRFFEARLTGETCLLMIDKAGRDEPPSVIRKHIEHIQTKWNGPVVYVRDRIVAYNRKRLIAQKVPFVVPGNQMYLPMLGVDLREHFRGKPQPARQSFRPSTQALLIHMLQQTHREFSPTELAQTLGYSAMTMGRALDELQAAGLGESSRSGRDRSLHLTEPKDAIWKKAQSFLRDPVKSRRPIRMTPGRDIPGPLAGLSALSRYSMLGEPDNTVVALSARNWKLLRQQDTVTEAAGELIVEVWSYDPTLLAREGVVDRLSLYLSLRRDPDERIETALDQMMGEVAW